MRRPSTRELLSAPLDAILGTEVQVRVLRILVLASQPLSLAEVARRTGVTKTGVAAAMKTLVLAGVAEGVGVAPSQMWQLRPSAPLARALAVLFTDERERVTQLWGMLAECVHRAGPALRSAWAWRPRPAPTATAGVASPPIRVALVASSADLARIRDTVRRELGEVEMALDVTVELQAWTPAELDDDLLPDDADVVVLAGVPPSALRRERSDQSRPARPHRSHAHADARLRNWGARIAHAVAENPGLIAEARQALQRRIATAPTRLRPALREWEQVLATMSPMRLQRFLVDEGERATRLRQSATQVWAGLVR